MLRGVFCPEAPLYQAIFETLRSLKTALSHRPDVLREGDMTVILAYPLFTLERKKSAFSARFAVSVPILKCTVEIVDIKSLRIGLV